MHVLEYVLDTTQCLGVLCQMRGHGLHIANDQTENDLLLTYELLAALLLEELLHINDR